MRTPFLVLSLLGLVACGRGETPAPAPKKAKKEAKKKDAKGKKKAKGKAKAKAKLDLAGKSPEEKKAALMKLGKSVYETGGSGGVACLTCHQANGQGLPGAFPPLVGAKEIMGDCKTHAGYVINGLQGQITVNGQVYNGVMPPQGNLSDDEIAAVVTYERNSWGNDYGLCLPKSVAEAR